MMEGPENLIFTACTGRCGQFSLVEYLNVFGKSCLAEAEPPDLIYPNHWPLGNWLRDVQRRWIVTDEDLGRGRALAWYDEDHRQPLEDLLRRRLKRISRLSLRASARTYVEVSKFFLRSYCDVIADARPDVGVILLRRDPLANAKSFSNRGKNFRLDGLMPDFRKACLRMDVELFSPFQLYLWQWVEIELRFQRFVESKRINRRYIFHTENLNSPRHIKDLFDYFEIDLVKPILRLEPLNTNQSKGRERTNLSNVDLDEFDHFYGMLPTDVRDKIPELSRYRDLYSPQINSQ